MNVIFIMNDTFRRDHLACYGNSWIRTPNLNRFAEHAALFEQCYVSSYPTVPNRWDLATGRYGFTHRGWQPLSPEDTTWAQLLQRKGVHTQMIWDTPMLGRNNYDYTRGFIGQTYVRGQKSDPWITDPSIDVRVPAQAHKIFTDDLLGYLRNHHNRRFDREYCVGRTISEASDWLETNYNHESFFLYVDMWQPHEPFDCPWYDLAHYADPAYKGEIIMFPKYGRPTYLSEEEQKYTRARYAGSCTQVDRWVGRLMDTMEGLGLFKNTLIIWTTDHGHLFGDHDLWGKPGSELGTLFETTARIPLMIHHPEGLGAGKRIGGLVQPPDILPTILEFMGVPIPPVVEGKSVWPLVTGQAQSIHECAFSSRFPPSGARRNPWYSTKDAALFDGWVGSDSLVEPATVTRGEWAFMCSTIEGASRLYNIASDPGQERNLIGKHPDVARSMRELWLDFLRARKAPEERIRPFVDLSRKPNLPPALRLSAFRDDRGQWIAFPTEEEARHHANRKCYLQADRKIEEVPFEGLVDDNPKNLIYLHNQYYWAQDLL